MRVKRVIHQPGPGRGRGVVIRHSRRCPVKRTGLDHRCLCSPTYDAWVYRDGAKIWRRFDTYHEAQAWRRREQAAPDQPTLTLVRRVEIAKAEYRDALRALLEHRRRTAA